MIYTVEYFENVEGGMNHGYYSDVEHDSIESADAECNEANLEMFKPFGNGCEGWVIVGRPDKI